ncbi:hypothetical protein LH128_19596 [Sphingomonas sp. LH128]|jgi:uncharacterized membrane protein YphA (DoxX/SURF4 family)|uniref:DoxX family protein n=1 Tax=Sphingomonas sp. LH128 TaxID=473781 RepID=UPI00027CC567|nr:DoxX family protein [Sphingomonas sp. LH128]EJU11306.1 hypothetical protein LH128_19596 [Sphingomonas sp. LH128]
MRRIADAILPHAVGAVFLAGALLNGTASASTWAEYVAWGYPHWFPYVTACLEVGAATLLFVPRTRLVGAALGAAIMVAALATLIRVGDYGHGTAPAVLILFCALTGWRATIRGKEERAKAGPDDRRSGNPWAGDEV